VAQEHALKSVPGALALAAWALYVLAAAVFYYPDYPASVWPIAGAGLLACAWVGLDLARWRLAVILASCVYLLFYAVRVLRMAALTAGFELSALPTTLLFYYKSSWAVTVAMREDKGVASSLMHGYIEYAMPILSVALVVLALCCQRRPTR
jgi:hypothetical protein